jgi:phytanoyl-CoA hydroxylase
MTTREGMLAPGVLERDVGAIVAEYRAQGFVLLPGVVSESMLAQLRARAADIMHGRVTYPGLFYQQDTTTGVYEDVEFGVGWVGPSENYRKIEKLEKDPVFFAWLKNPFFERIARAVITPPGGAAGAAGAANAASGITLYRAILMTKAAHGGTRLPWHQDAGKFWGLDRDPPLQIWTALDDAPVEAGCVEVLPGSHLPGLATPLGGLVPARCVADADAEARALPVPARAGDVLLLHNHLWHRSGVNVTDHTRRAFSVCYMSGEAKCTRKKRAPRTFTRVFE